jgi:hypothetical protein
MRICTDVGRIVGSRGEPGRMQLMLVGRHWSLDVYRWRDRHVECWWMPATGVWWSMRIGHVAWQVRRR